MKVVASCHNLSKQFGNIVALNKLNLQVTAGQAVALLGPNGAGKSTALSLMQGIRQPTSGEIKLFDHKPGHPEAMAKIGVTPQAANFPPQLTPVEMIEFTSAHFASPHSTEYLVDTFGLSKFATRRIDGFSGGQLRRTALAMCFAGDPELVFLDEPTAGLDVEGQERFQKFARQFVESGGGLILTSHNWREIENVADSIVMIDEGATVIHGTINDIKSAVNVSEVSLASTSPNAFIEQNFERVGKAWKRTTNTSDELVTGLVNSKAEFSRLTISPCTLEEAIDTYRQNEA